MVFLAFFGFFWDDILTLNLNTKKNQKIPKKNQKKPKKPNGAQKTSFQFRMLAKVYAKKNQKKPKKTKKNQFPISNSGQNQCQKNQKKPKKKPKKTNANLEILKNQKKPKKTKKNQCQFTDFGVATGFFGFFLGEHPPPTVYCVVFI